MPSDTYGHTEAMRDLEAVRDGSERTQTSTRELYDAHKRIAAYIATLEARTALSEHTPSSGCVYRDIDACPVLHPVSDDAVREAVDGIEHAIRASFAYAETRVGFDEARRVAAGDRASLRTLTRALITAQRDKERMEAVVEAARRGCDKCHYQYEQVQLCRDEAGCGFAATRAALARYHALKGASTDD